ncbi:PBSX family phage terminase large subunit [Streptomyces sp. NPDC004532]
MMRPKLALSAKQVDSIVEARAFQNVWDGSVRSGKTISSLIRWLEFVADRPQMGELVMVGRTRDSLARNVFGPLTDPNVFGPLARDITYTSGAPTASVLGVTVHALGANDAQAEPKVRGLTCAGAYVDEITTLSKSFYDQLNARCSVDGSAIFGTTNPDNPQHWLRRDYLLRPREQRLKAWHFVMDDNPGLSEEYKARQRAAHTGLFYKRNILGEWVMAEGAIYESYDEARHVVNDLPDIVRWLSLGIDYGTTNAFVALMLGIGADNRLYVTAEYRHDSRQVGRSMTDAEYDTALRDWLAEQPGTPEWVVIDPSAASFIEQLHRTGGLPIVPADNTVRDGIRTVASLLAADRLRIHRSCVGLLEELPGYVWDPKASDRGEDAPLKVADHGPDALRYAIRTTESVWRQYIPMITQEVSA